MLAEIVDVDPSVRNSIQAVRETIVAADRRLSYLLDGQKSVTILQNMRFYKAQKSTNYLNQHILKML